MLAPRTPESLCHIFIYIPLTVTHAWNMCATVPPLYYMSLHENIHTCVRAYKLMYIYMYMCISFVWTNERRGSEIRFGCKRRVKEISKPVFTAFFLFKHVHQIAFKSSSCVGSSRIEGSKELNSLHI